MKKWFARCPHCDATVSGQIIELIGGKWLFAGQCKICTGRERNIRIVADSVAEFRKHNVWVGK